MNLRAHLSGHVFLFGGLGDESSLPNGVRQGLFAVDVKAGADGPDAGRDMVMIGRADDDGIELTSFFFEQFAVVGVATGFWETLGKAVEVSFVDVAQGDDVFAGDAVDIFRSPIGRANDGNVEFFIGGFCPGHGKPA